MKPTAVTRFIYSGLILLLPYWVPAQTAGSLDSSFGVAGVRTVNIKAERWNYNVADYVQMNTGAIITAGTNGSKGRLEDLVLIRYKPDGTVDSSVWTDGLLYFGKRFTQPFKPLNKMLLSESTGNLYLLYTDNNNRPGVLNLDINGTVNTAFAQDGFWLADRFLLPFFNSYELTTDRTIQQLDGCLLFSGQGVLREKPDSTVIFSFRLKIDGTIDTAFGSKGISIPVIRRNTAIVKDVHLFADDSLVYTFQYQNNFAVCKTDSLGTLNEAFGDQGILKTNIWDASPELNCISLPQPDGTLMLTRFTNDGSFTTRYLADGTKANTFYAGNFDYNLFYDGIFTFALKNYQVLASGDLVMLLQGKLPYGTTKYHIAKLKPDGTLAENFGDKGFVAFAKKGNDNPVQLKTSEKASGQWTTLSTGEAIELARYTYTGTQLTFNQTFGNSGRAAYTFPQSHDYPFGVGKLKDGRFIVAGKTANDSDTTIYLFRYSTDGKKDITFGKSGTVSYKVPTNYSIYNRNGVLVNSDNQVLMPFIKNSGSGILLYCLDKDGALVKSYGNNGVATFEWNSDRRLQGVRQLLEQPDKKILLLANCGDFGYTAGFLCRLMPDGKKDTLFGNKGMVEVSTWNYDEPSTFCYTSKHQIVVNIGAANQDGRKVRYNYWGDIDTSFITYKQPTGSFYWPGQEAFDVFEQDSVYVSFTNEYYNYYDDNYTLFMYRTPVQKEQIRLSKRIKIPFPAWADSIQNGRRATKIFRQNNGSYIIAMSNSYYKNDNYYTQLTLTRVDAQGTIDSSFGTNGYFLFDRLDVAVINGDYIDRLASLIQFSATADHNLLVSTIATDEQLEDITLFKIRTNDNPFATPVIYPPVPLHPSQVVTAIRDVSPAQSFAVFPNPTTGKISFRLPASVSGKKAALQIFRADGSLAETGAITCNLNHTVRLRHYSNGLYTIRITVAQKIFVSSFMVQ